MVSPESALIPTISEPLERGGGKEGRRGVGERGEGEEGGGRREGEEWGGGGGKERSWGGGGRREGEELGGGGEDGRRGVSRGRTGGIKESTLRGSIKDESKCTLVLSPGSSLFHT